MGSGCKEIGGETMNMGEAAGNFGERNVRILGKRILEIRKVGIRRFLGQVCGVIGT